MRYATLLDPFDPEFYARMHDRLRHLRGITQTLPFVHFRTMRAGKALRMDRIDALCGFRQPEKAARRNTIPLHAPTAGRSADFMLIAPVKIEEPPTRSASLNDGHAQSRTRPATEHKRMNTDGVPK